MIYILTRVGAVNYNEYEAKIVRATNEQEARVIANEMPGDEGAIWTDTNKVTCETLETKGASGVLLTDFKDGGGV